MTEISTSKKDMSISPILVSAILVWMLWATVRLVPWLSTALLAALFAALLSTAINKAAGALHRLTSLPKRACAILLFLALIALFALGFFTLGGKLIKEAEELILSLSVYRADADALVMRLTLTAADRLSAILPFDVEAEYLSDVLVSASDGIITYVASAVGRLAASALGASPKIFLAAVTFLTACFYMTADYDLIKNALLSLLPKRLRDSLPSFQKNAMSVAKKCAVAYLIFFIMTALTVWIGLCVLRSPSPLIMALTVAAVDLLPVFGAGAVLLPWSLFSFAIGESGFALGLLIIYVIVTAVRKIAEPKVLGDGLGVHPLLSLAFMTVCGMLFGFIGLLLSPLCAYLFSEFIKKRAKSKKM